MSGPVEAPVYLAHGRVRHARQTVKPHAFDTSAFYIRININRLKDIAATRWFSVKGKSVFSFNPADHGDGKATLDNPAGWLLQLLRDEGVTETPADIWLHCFPRMLGYLFNPVSFWFCHRADGSLLCIVCEVNNTFGEKHCYLLHDADKPIAEGRLWEAKKEFHVSPFFEVLGNYRFRFHHNHERGVSRVDLVGPEGVRINTSISGAFTQPDDAAWRATLFKYKWFTLGVMAKIHWHALQLWLKGVPFFTKPQPPSALTTRSDLH